MPKQFAVTRYFDFSNFLTTEFHRHFEPFRNNSNKTQTFKTEDGHYKK